MTTTSPRPTTDSSPEPVLLALYNYDADYYLYQIHDSHPPQFQDADLKQAYDFADNGLGLVYYQDLLEIARERGIDQMYVFAYSHNATDNNQNQSFVGPIDLPS